MAFDPSSLDDYVPVADRIAAFRTRYPEGSLQPADLNRPYTIETIGEQAYIVVVAAAYRTPDDPRPGIGSAWEICPGKTSYTRGSELQNAETSAWGRALIAVLAADPRRGVASADEVRNRRADQAVAEQAPAPAPMTGPQRKHMFALFARAGIEGADAQRSFCDLALGYEPGTTVTRGGLTSAEVDVVIAELTDKALIADAVG